MRGWRAKPEKAESFCWASVDRVGLRMGGEMGSCEAWKPAASSNRGEIEESRGNGEQCVAKTELVAKAELLELMSQ